MPSQNFEFAYHLGGGKQGDIGYALGAKSAVTNPFDPVVLTTAAAQTTSSNPVARKLLAADVTASYLEGGAKAGIYGFAGQEHYSNSSGVASTQAVPSSISAAGQPILPLPNYGAGIDADPTIGYSRLKIYLATPENVFKGKLGGGGDLTATNAHKNTKAGIDISGSGSTAIYTVDTSESVKPLIIIGFDEVDPTWVYFTVDPLYCQSRTGVNYSTQ